MLLWVSYGEAIDKLSILELKKSKITLTERQIEIDKELKQLEEVNILKQSYPYYYQLLMYVNEKMWILTDDIKSMTIDNGKYNQMVFDLMLYNEKRYRIKNLINQLANSDIKEQKSYSQTKVKIIITDYECIYKKLPEINILALDYDLVYFESPYLDKLMTIFTTPNFIYPAIISSETLYCQQYPYVQASDYFKTRAYLHYQHTPDVPWPKYHSENSNIDVNQTINLEKYNLNPDRQYFEFPPLIYVSGGLLGDFINQLGVIQAMYLKTGRKGILYISNIGDSFRMGLEYTYKDTYALVIQQNYIVSYEIHRGQPYDINLSQWRSNESLISRRNLSYIFHDEYNIHWGQKWLHLPKFKNNLVLLHLNSTRYDPHFKIIIDQITAPIYFITTNIQEKTSSTPL